MAVRYNLTFNQKQLNAYNHNTQFGFYRAYAHRHQRKEKTEMTQQERILNYIKMFGSISPIEAFTDLGITKLATRVSEMRKEGIAINGEMESARNRFGDKVHYMRYSLEAKK